MLQNIKKKKTQDTMGLPETCKFVIGLSFMVTSNIDVSDGLVNGAIGTVKYVERDPTNKNRIKRIWMEFSDKNVGRKLRKSVISYVTSNNISSNFVPIKRRKLLIHSSRNGSGSVYRSQFPLVCAEAITVHKSQGATYEKIAIPFDYKFNRSLLYVSMSRVTTLEGLYGLNSNFKQAGILKTNEIDFKEEEYEKMRKRTKVPEFLKFYQKEKDYGESIVIGYQNVQSLLTHLEDVKSDYLLIDTDILFFCETHTLEKDEITIPGFEIAARFNSDPFIRKNRGLIVYTKVHLEFINAIQNSQFEICTVRTLHIQFFLVYFAPSMSNDRKLESLIDFINSNKIMKHIILLLGDFNVNFKSNDGENFISHIFKNIKLIKVSNQYTTKKNTEIDAVFSNCGIHEYFVYYTAYSYYFSIMSKIKYVNSS